MCNGRFSLKDVARIVKEIATTATELNDSSKQLLLHQVKRLESIPAQEETKDILVRPFPKEVIKQKEGKKGKTFSYVEPAEVIERLNEAFSFKWSWKILSHQVINRQVFCQGRLTVRIDGETVIKEAFGSQEIEYLKGTQTPVNELGNDFKSASSDAMKKAASMLGVGLHLYKKSGNNTSNQGNKAPINNKSSRTGVLAPKN